MTPMGRKSSLETALAAEDKAALGRLITSGKWTLNGLLEWLGERGYGISRSALGRHVQKTEKVAAKLRESRSVTEALVQQLGPDVTEGRQGRLLVEIARSLIFDFQMKMLEAEDGEAGMKPGDFFFIGKALKEMAQAARLDQDFETKIRETAKAEATAEAARAIETAGRAAGVSAETLAAMRKALGAAP